MSRDTNIAAQEHLAENVNHGNIDAAVESFAPDAVDHDPAPGQPAGRKGFKAFFTELTAAFPDAHIDPAHLVADDNNVAVAYTLTGTHEGEFQRYRAHRQEDRGARPADRALRDGQIVERWGSSDELRNPPATRCRAEALRRTGQAHCKLAS